MNKKILSIFVMVMALSLLGVSCSNKDKTGAGDTTSKEITLAQIQNAVRLLGDLNDASGNSGSVDFRNVIVGKDAAVAVEAKAGSSGLTASAVTTLIEGAKSNVKLANTTVTVDISSIASGGGTTSFTIKFVANSGYSITGFNTGVVKDESGKKAVTITVTMTGKDSTGSSTENFS